MARKSNSTKRSRTTGSNAENDTINSDDERLVTKPVDNDDNEDIDDIEGNVDTGSLTFAEGESSASSPNKTPGKRAVSEMTRAVADSNGVKQQQCTAVEIEAKRRDALARLAESKARSAALMNTARNSSAGATSAKKAYMSSGKYGSASGLILSAFLRPMTVKGEEKTTCTFKVLIAKMSGEPKVEAESGRLYWDIVATIDDKTANAGYTKDSPGATVRVYEGDILSINTLNDLMLEGYKKDKTPYMTLANVNLRGYVNKDGLFKTSFSFSGAGMMALKATDAEVFNELAKIYVSYVSLPHPNALSRITPSEFYEKTRPFLLRLKSEMGDTFDFAVDPVTMPMDGPAASHTAVAILDMDVINAVKPATDANPPVPAKQFVKLLIKFLCDDGEHKSMFRAMLTLWGNHLSFITASTDATATVLNSHLPMVLTHYTQYIVYNKLGESSKFLANSSADADGDEEMDDTFHDEGVLSLGVHSMHVAVGQFLKTWGIPISRSKAVQLMNNGSPTHSTIVTADTPSSLSVDSGVLNLRELASGPCESVINTVPTGWKFVVLLPKGIASETVDEERKVSLMTEEEGDKLCTLGEGNQGRATNINGESIKLPKDYFKPHNNIVLAYDPVKNVYPCFDPGLDPAKVALKPAFKPYTYLVPHTAPFGDSTDSHQVEMDTA